MQQLLTAEQIEHGVARMASEIQRIPDRFVVGYGLDYHDLYRHLPYLAALEDHELTDDREETGSLRTPLADERHTPRPGT